MTASVLSLFEANVMPEPNSGCWLWMGGTVKRGYGRFNIPRRLGGQRRKAHQLSYELYRGLIPAGLELDHLCRVPSCVNPEHLEPVTHQMNVLRGAGPSAIHATKTHCPRGHLYDMRTAKGGRWCLACRTTTNRAVYLQRRAAGYYEARRLEAAKEHAF